jgi:hypothetical protein
MYMVLKYTSQYIPYDITLHSSITLWLYGAFVNISYDNSYKIINFRRRGGSGGEVALRRRGGS